MKKSCGFGFLTFDHKSHKNQNSAKRAEICDFLHSLGLLRGSPVNSEHYDGDESLSPSYGDSDILPYPIQDKSPWWMWIIVGISFFIAMYYVLYEDGGKH